MLRSNHTANSVAPHYGRGERRADRFVRALALAMALLAPLSLARAGATVDPSGHWDGSIHAPSRDIEISIDLTLDKAGKLTGTLTKPGEGITGYPLATAAVDGSAVRLDVRTGGSGAQTLAGKVAADCKSMSGDFLVGVYSVPFDMKRTGEAKFTPAPKSAAIDAALAGQWVSSLEIEGHVLPVVLNLANRGDGTSAGNWAAGDGSATPVAIAQHERELAVKSTVTSARYTGTLSADGKEIAGTFAEGALQQAMTFRRAGGAR